MWTETAGYGLESLSANREIILGSHLSIGDNGTFVSIGEEGIDIERPKGDSLISISTNIKIGSNVEIGSNVFINPGFNSEDLTGAYLWKKISDGSFRSADSDSAISLGSRVSIGLNRRVEINNNGITVMEDSSNMLQIGPNVTICKDSEGLRISSAGIEVYNPFDDDDPNKIYIGTGVYIENVTLKKNVYIQENFDTRHYIDSNNKLIPSKIPTDSSIKNETQLAVNIEPQSNGNIKIGETLFMPATPSGDPMHYAYETAGAVYNGTTDFIVKKAPWKDMVDTIEDKAKWGFDVVDASQVKQMTIGGTTYNYVQTTRQSPEGTTEPRYFLVGQASDGTWVEDETKVLHLPGHWYLVGLGDITNKEMRRILDEKEVKYRWDKTRGGQGALARTVIPVNTIRNIDMIPTLVTPYGIHAESICITFVSHFKAPEPAVALSVNNTGTTNRTRYIQTCKDASGTPFSNACVVSFIKLTQNCNISNVPLLSKPSILYTIDTATPTTAITITLHADRYAQLAEDADIVAALEAKNTALEGTGGSISLVSA